LTYPVEGFFIICLPQAATFPFLP